MVECAERGPRRTWGRTAGILPILAAMTPERFRRLTWILERRQPDLTVLMDRVHKPHNFSAVLRTCDAVGVFRAHLVPTADFTPRRHIASGANRYVRVVRHRTLDGAVARLRKEGLTLVAAHLSEDAVDFRALDYTRPTALVLGTEKDGISAEALAAADRVVGIPMVGAATSLNVSVAAALILYEAQRQRQAAGLYDESRLPADRVHPTLFEWAYPRIAALCRQRGVPYPPLGPEGQIRGELPR